MWEIIMKKSMKLQLNTNWDYKLSKINLNKEIIMKNLLISLLILVVATLGFADKVVKKEFKVKPGGTLIVDLKTGGSLEITGWKKNLVDIKFSVEGKDADEVKVETDQSGNQVEFLSRFPKEKGNYKVKVHLEVMVPAKFDLQLESRGGKFKISNVEGKIGGLTMGGSLDLNKLTGFLKLKTMGGEISLNDSTVEGLLKTGGGKVFLKNIIGDIDAESMGGSVVYQNVKSSKGATDGKVIRIKSMGGSIKLKEAANGAKVKTMGGSININSAQKFVDAHTMGGKINIGAIDGWVSATTMGGDIEVTMVGDPDKGKRDVKLKTKGGDVTLYVPKGMSMDFDIQLEFTKRAKKTYKIISDFDLKTETSKDWDYSKGSPRKTISGTGKVKGGKHTVYISNVNGNIIIKEKN